ncbi:MAG: O-antigen ligase family protein [Gammaproteobacteria bacterium]|nr:O-antigen ligase family protein [Gammaproteobacteria bacterium]
MLVTTVFLIVVLAFFTLTSINFRSGFFAFLFLYGVYPRFFALGLSGEGFALTGQRAMLLILAGFFVLRVLWGSAEVMRALDIAKRYKTVFVYIGALLLARLIGNIVTSRIDVGSLGAAVSEMLLSLFVTLLVITYAKTRKDMGLMISLVVLSLLINQVVATYEFSIGESVFPQSIDLQYQEDRSDEELLEGKERGDTYRAMGLFDNALELAGLLCLTLPLAMSMAATSSGYLLRISALFVVMMALPTALFSGSRAALGVSLLIFSWYLFRFVGRGLSSKGRFFLGAVGVLAGSALLFATATGLLQALLFGEGFAGSTTYRVFQYVQGFTALLESPAFGFGYARNIGDVVLIRPLDSYYLRMTLEGGVVALLAVLLILKKVFSLSREVCRMATTAADYSIAHAIGVSISVAALIMLVFSLPADRLYVFMLAGLVISLHHRVRESVESAPV